MKRTISVLGCGWLGEPLALQLINNGFEVKGSTTSSSKLSRLKEAGIEPYLIALESIPSGISSFLDTEILIVNVPSKNVDRFKELVDHVVNSSIKKVVFISSTSVYSYSKDLITEKSAVNTSALVDIEQLFNTNSQFETTVVRFSGLFGYNRKPGNWFSNGKKIPNPEGFVNMIHQDDCIRIIEVIINQDIWNETFNGCADTHPTRREFYTKAKLSIGGGLPEFEETDLPQYKIISSEKLEKMGFTFKYPDLMVGNQIL